MSLDFSDLESTYLASKNLKSGFNLRGERIPVPYRFHLEPGITLRYTGSSFFGTWNLLIRTKNLESTPKNFVALERACYYGKAHEDSSTKEQK